MTGSSSLVFVKSGGLVVSRVSLVTVVYLDTENTHRLRVTSTDKREIFIALASSRLPLLKIIITSNRVSLASVHFKTQKAV